MAQFYRDVRITPIYEGTNGIQAIDLVGRKLVRDQGAAAYALIAEMRDLPAMAPTLSSSIDAVEKATTYLLEAWEAIPRARWPVRRHISPCSRPWPAAG